MKKIAILGSTGSIGQNTLRVARHLNEEIEVVALAAGSNVEVIEAQVKEFQPRIVALFNEDKAVELQRRLPQVDVLSGDEGLRAVATAPEAEMVVSAIAGTRGFAPTLTAIEAGKDIGLANKETLVSGGALVMKAAQRSGAAIIPIDSEHSAIFQCLQGENRQTIRRLILTASGGPFREFSDQELAQVTVDHALAHPTWSMGPKVTIDSSTLMNKGLEVIEAHWLFDLPIDQIEVVVHPQSVIHSMVEYNDGSLIAQMGEPTMITPIQYAITYPTRLPGFLKPFDFTQSRTLNFYPPNRDRFRCLSLAYHAIKTGGSLPCYMNAANETLVHRFLKKQISWHAIPTQLETLMQQHNNVPLTSPDLIPEIEAEAHADAMQ